MKYKAPFIVFEGIDGSGKSTQAKMLFDFIITQNQKAYLGFEPTDEKWGKQIRDILAGKEFPTAEKMVELFINDRQDDVKRNIKPNLENKTTVILDRYYYSNAAYQGAMGLTADYILQQNKKQNFPEPDCIYLIDITPELALQRISLRNQNAEKDLFEKSSFLKKVYTIYKNISKQHPQFCVIDGSQSIQQIHSAIVSDYRDRFSEE